MTDLSGKFIVLDGPDGCGKSTQVRLLGDWLQKQDVEVRTFRDPGDTDIGDGIRELLLSRQHERMANMTELLLYMASRTQLWYEKIKPALDKAYCVVLDRWLSSTCAYQGYAGGFGMDRVMRIAEDALERVWPDMTLILDVDLATATRRMNRERDRIELKGNDYHRKVREGFLALTQTHPNFVVVEATEPVETVHKQITDQVSRLLTLES